MKARTAGEVTKFTDIPNIGPAMVEDFILLGVKTLKALGKADGFKLYTLLCKKTGTRHDPCVLDTFLAAVDFMQGAPAKPWWTYTKLRKKQYPDI